MKEINARLNPDISLRLQEAGRMAADIWGEIYDHTEVMDGITAIFDTMDTMVDNGDYQNAFDILYVLHAMNGYLLEIPIQWICQKPKLVEEFMKAFIRESYDMILEIDQIDDVLLHEHNDYPEYVHTDDDDDDEE